jgi:predicted TIM-barrel fold metal-dependent hydrolase
MSRYLISADSHVFEPADLWEKRLPLRLRNQAPRRERKGDRDVFTMGGQTVFSLRRAEAGEEASSRGGADLAERIRDLETDGVAGEVIYPTLGLFLFQVSDPVLALACGRTYNDWCRETFFGRKDVFAPVALIPVVNVEDAVVELERIAGLGFRAAMPPIHAPSGRPYTDPVYDPLWKTASRARIPLSFHVGTGAKPVTERGPGGAIINYLRVGTAAQDAVAYFAAGGVLARHPDLQIVIAEAGAGWLGYVCERMDEAFAEHQAWVSPKLDASPSEYIRRQVHVSFGAERAPLLNLEITTARPLLWASDYPHPEGTWPESQKKVAESLRGLRDDEINAIVGGNARSLYRFP